MGELMMRKILLALLSTTLGLGVAAAAAATGGYHVTGSIAIGGEGGWDYVTADAAAHRLYVSHATCVQVVDTRTNTIIGEIPDTLGVHGIALARSLGRGYISDGRADTVTVFDLKTLKLLATIKVTGGNPDAIAFEPVTRRVFTFNGRGHNITAIDTATNTVVGTIDLGAKPEFAVADGTGEVFFNLESTSQLAVLDARTLKVRARWPLAPGREPTGLAIDRKHRRLFSVCGNGLMVIVNADTGKVVATEPIGRGVDGAAFDPGTGTAFASAGQGVLTVVREDSPTTFTVVANVPTKRGARTVALDTSAHRLYLPTARFGPPPSPTPQHQHRWPRVLPGTFEVLIVSR